MSAFIADEIKRLRNTINFNKFCNHFLYYVYNMQTTKLQIRPKQKGNIFFPPLGNVGSDTIS